MGRIAEGSSDGFRDLYRRYAPMGAPPSGSVYELWLAKDARYIPVRTFSPDGGNVVLPFKVDPDSYTSTAVTIEHAYVRQPTRPPIYFASIPT